MNSNWIMTTAVAMLAAWPAVAEDARAALIERAKSFELDTPYVPPPGDPLSHHTSGYVNVDRLRQMRFSSPTQPIYTKDRETLAAMSAEDRTAFLRDLFGPFTSGTASVVGYIVYHWTAGTDRFLIKVDAMRSSSHGFELSFSSNRGKIPCGAAVLDYFRPRNEKEYFEYKPTA